MRKTQSGKNSQPQQGQGQREDEGHEAGIVDAVSDIDAFLARNLSRGGTRSIHVLDNDFYNELDPVSHSATFEVNEHVGYVNVLNAPAGYDLQWFNEAVGTGSHAFGNYEFDGSFSGATYSSDGVYAYASWSGDLTFRSPGLPARTFSASYSTVTVNDYERSDFGDTRGEISIAASMDSGDGSVLITFDNYQAIRAYGESATFGLSGDIFASGVDIVDVSSPSHGTADHSGGPVITYTPDENTEEETDSFTYTISTLIGQRDTSSVSVEARPDRVSVRFEQDAWEVPPKPNGVEPLSADFHPGKFIFSRQDRPDEPIGLGHATTVYFTVSGDGSGDWTSEDIPPSGWNDENGQKVYGSQFLSARRNVK